MTADILLVERAAAPSDADAEMGKRIAAEDVAAMARAE